MYAVMIADDDVAVRSQLRNIIDWEGSGFEIVAEAKNGKQALKQLKERTIHLLITDMKMPVLEGLDLIKEVNLQETLVIALSSFEEYGLVREAFKLGIEDYILKMNLEKDYIDNIIQKIKKKLDEKSDVITQSYVKTNLSLYIENPNIVIDDQQTYGIILVDLDEIKKRQSRFIDTHKDLILPMIELIRQIPHMLQNCECEEYTEALLAIRYYKEDLGTSNLLRLSKQIYSLLRDYMNIEVTISISSIYDNISLIPQALAEATKLLTQRCIFGEGKVFHRESEYLLDFEELEREKHCYNNLLEAFRLRDNNAMLMEEERLFSVFMGFDKEKLHRYCLYMIYLEGLMLMNNDDSIANVFGKSVCYPDKLSRLISENDYIIWMYNLNRFLFEYLSKITNNKVEQTLEIARRYILDNYADEGLDLAEVASIAGLNESYFSSKFKKEFGKSFVEYLKDVRINHAKKLMENTNLKIYEISQAVGYRNVEHFTRIFKAHVGVTPKQYKS